MNLSQQLQLQRIAGADILQRIGVPGAPAVSQPISQPLAYGGGGTVPALSFAPRSAAPDQPIYINAEFVFELGAGDNSRAFVRAARSEDGRAGIFRNLKEGRRDGEIR